MTQELAWNGARYRRASPPDTMFALTGRRLYVIGDVDGGFRPRSNPYDLYAAGKPDPDDPLAEKLQGVWAQPVRGLAGYGYTLTTGAEPWRLEDAVSFTQSFVTARFDYRQGALSAARVDFVPLDQPVLFSTLTLKNEGERTLKSQLSFEAKFDLEDAWFTALTDQRNTRETLTVEGERLVARAAAAPERWAAAVGAERKPDRVSADGATGRMQYDIRLAPGEEQSWTFALAVESQGGAVAALAALNDWLPQRKALLAHKEAVYRRALDGGPLLHSPDPAFDAAFRLAKANMQFLEAESPALGRYFYAGLEMFPFWFSNDGAYSLPGLMASGFGETAFNHLRIGQRWQERGSVPHQISPSGKTAFPGNAEETALWVAAIWDAYRWSGDQDFLAELYPAAVGGIFDHTLGSIDADGDGYPEGPGMVEVDGMGVEKLDSAAYTWDALRALEKMALALQDEPTARRAQQTAAGIQARFERDWWDEAGGTYAMSLGENNQRQTASHWAILTPLEVGLASPEHAARTLATVRAHYLNEWGLKHTAGDDQRVWTLPTAALSRSAYRNGEPQLGYEMLKHVSETLDHGSAGMFHELIPEGFCFVQLWSGATFVRGVVEDLLGVQVDAGEHRIRLSPQLPGGWERAELEGLAFGQHVVDVAVEPGRVTVRHCSGPQALEVLYWNQEGR